MGNTILCFSGGIDSLVAWYYLGKPTSIFFNCTDYSSAESVAVTALNPLCIIDNSLSLQKFQEKENAYIPHRNLLFASIASNYAPNVVIAGVKDDKVRDKNVMAFDLMSKVLSRTSNKDITVTSPFWKMDKKDVIRWFLDNVEYAEDILRESVSCYNNMKYCGICKSCFRKANALWENGIKIRYHNHIMMKDYFSNAVDGYYSKTRNKSIIRFYNEYQEWKSTLDSEG